jgi:hypothetical protein
MCFERFKSRVNFEEILTKRHREFLGNKNLVSVGVAQGLEKK